MESASRSCSRTRLLASGTAIGRSCGSAAATAGFIAIDPATVRDDIRFADCAFVDGLPLRGTGRYVFERGDRHWSVTVPDGSLDFESNGRPRTSRGRGRARRSI